MFSISLIVQISVYLKKNAHNLTLLLWQRWFLPEIFSIFNYANMVGKLAFDKENPLNVRLTTGCLLWCWIDVTKRNHLMQNTTCALFLVNKHYVLIYRQYPTECFVDILFSEMLYGEWIQNATKSCQDVSTLSCHTSSLNIRKESFVSHSKNKY